ncbi:hypothetical protein INR49_001144 [Caranx melampygus]|nr:hypothetical protein INR49_001144 [Caranx melampygus]
MVVTFFHLLTQTRWSQSEGCVHTAVTQVSSPAPTLFHQLSHQFLQFHCLRCVQVSHHSRDIAVF